MHGVFCGSSLSGWMSWCEYHFNILICLFHMLSQSNMMMWMLPFKMSHLSYSLSKAKKFELIERIKRSYYYSSFSNFWSTCPSQTCFTIRCYIFDMLGFLCTEQLACIFNTCYCKWLGYYVNHFMCRHHFCNWNWTNEWMDGYSKVAKREKLLKLFYAKLVLRNLRW